MKCGRSDARVGQAGGCRPHPRPRTPHSRPLPLLCLLLTVAQTPLPAADASIVLPTPSEGATQDFCETETFNATCGSGQVILITHARYGRMRMSRCVKLNYGHLGCANNVTVLADSRCSGRPHCVIRVPDALFAQTLPCPDDLKPYFEVGYKCVNVRSADSKTCTSQRVLPITTSEGYIASDVTDSTGCGGTRSPWEVVTRPGQRVQLTLYDFGVHARGPEGSGQCQKYAAIRERFGGPGPGGRTRKLTVCGGGVRRKVVYTSTSTRVQVAVEREPGGAGAVSAPSFMLRYEAVGCPDVAAPDHSWAVRLGDGLRVSCNYSRDIFHLKCAGTEWVGQLGNCSKAPNPSPDKLELEDIGIPYVNVLPKTTDNRYWHCHRRWSSLSILIVLAIALVIGLFVLLVGLLFLKRQRGLCTGRRYGNPQASPSRVGIPDNKEYVRATWLPRDRDQISMGSVGGKSVTWGRDTGYGPLGVGAAGVGPGDLPPCTPLMDRSHPPPQYGQLGAPRMACGCGVYDTGCGPGCAPVGVGGGEPDYAAKQTLFPTLPPGQGGQSPRHEKLIVRDAQYFVVSQPGVRGGALCGESPYGCRRAVLQQTLPRGAGGGDPPPRAAPTGTRPLSGPPRSGLGPATLQTDDIKLKLRTTEAGAGPGPGQGQGPGAGQGGEPPGDPAPTPRPTADKSQAPDGRDRTDGRATDKADPGAS